MAENITTINSSLRVPDVPRGPTAAPLSGPGRAMQSAGDALEQAGLTITRVRQEAQVNAAQTEAMERLNDLSVEIEQDPDYTSSVQRFEDGAAKIRADIEKKIGFGRAQRVFGERFEGLRIGRKLQVQKTAFSRQSDAAVASLNAALDGFAREAAAADTPEARISYAALAERAIMDAAGAGYLTATQAQKAADGFTSNMATASITGLIGRDPSAALAVLEDHDKLPGLDPIKRAQLASQARNAVRRRDFEIESLIRDDVASVKATGQGLGIDREAVAARAGDKAAAKWEQSRAAAEAYWTATHDMAELPAEDLAARVADLEPKPGAAGFDLRQDLHDAAAKEAARITKLRRDDPAAAVHDLPDVVAARQALQAAPNDPAAAQAAVRASLAAQERIGIPAYARRAISKPAARGLAGPLIAAGRMTGRDDMSRGERDALEAVFEGVVQRYGPLAEDILPLVVEETTKDRTIGRATMALLRKAAAGEAARPSEARAGDVETDAGDAAAAVGQPRAPSVPLDAPFEPGPQGEAQPQGWPAPPARAWMALVQNPALAPDFDRKYGPGAANRILKERANGG